MRSDRASKTAEVTAAIRAAHLRYARPAVFADHYALELTSPGWRRVVRSRLLHALVIDGLLRASRPIAAQVVMRARYCEDVLERAIARGVRQYVIVGAGLDSFALRRPELAGGLRVFELDHPASQAAKRAKLAGLAAPLPVNLEFVPVDFERATVAEALAGSTFDRGAPAFFSWLGTTHYLSAAAIFATLGSIGGSAADGSGIVFDYTVQGEGLSPEDRRELQQARRFVARRGEPFVSSFEPAALMAAVGTLGFRLVEDLDSDEQRRRYFAGRSDGLRPTVHTHVVHYEVARGDGPPRG